MLAISAKKANNNKPTLTFPITTTKPNINNNSSSRNMMQELFKVVEKLHNLELYDDLYLFAELHLPGEPSKMFIDCDELEEDQRGYLLYCLANACAQLNHFTQAIRNFEMAIRYLGNIRQRKLQNRYEHVLNTAEMRFQMHKLYLQNRQEEEALRCLESVPRAELTPKVLLAMSRLCHQLAKPPSQNSRALFNKRADTPNTRVVNYFKAIVKNVPEAIYCQSFLLSVGAVKLPSSPPAASQSPKAQSPTSSTSTSAAVDEHPAEPGSHFLSPEARIWAEVKQLQAQKRFLEAARLLDTAPSATNLRFLLEQARFYRIAGDQQKALACYQQAHLLDSTNAEGMDTFAALLGTFNNSQQAQRELDSLAHKMVHSNPRRPEAFVVYGWSQRQSHRINEAKQFAQRAEQQAGRRGRQRCEALLLKAQLLLDTKRHYKDMEMVLADALYNDSTNTAVYALYIQMFIAQKRYAEAQRMARAALKFVGEKNHQIRFLLAQALADDTAGGGQSGTDQAIGMLEKMVQEGHFLSLDPLLLLARLYDRQQKYEKAIALLNRFKESYGDPRIHRELGDLLSKTNRAGEALGEYGQALGSSNGTDPASKEKMLSLMGGFTTPQCAVNAAFENNAEGAGGAGGGVAGGSSSSGPVNPRGIRMPPPVARVTRRTAINQHEQLRRLRGMGTMSATGSLSSGTSTNRAAAQQRQTARMSTSGARPRMMPSGSSNSTTSSSGGGIMARVSGFSPVLAPLRFDDDEQQQRQGQDNNRREVVEDSDEEEEGEGDESDVSQLSLDGDAGEEDRDRAQQHNTSSPAALEQSRASNGQASTTTGPRAGGDQALQHMVRDIQRYLAAGRSLPPERERATTSTSSAAAGGQSSSAAAGRRRTTTTTVQPRPASFGEDFNEDTEFIPLVADEPLFGEEVDDSASHMSIDLGTAEGEGEDALALSEDEDMHG